MLCEPCSCFILVRLRHIPPGWHGMDSDGRGLVQDLFACRTGAVPLRTHFSHAFTLRAPATRCTYTHAPHLPHTTPHTRVLR